MPKIRDYLPKPNEVLIQGRIKQDTAKQIRAILAEKKITWNELLEACLTKFIDEMKEEEKYDVR